jgi:hypothetical protein
MSTTLIYQPAIVPHGPYGPLSPIAYTDVSREDYEALRLQDMVRFNILMDANLDLCLADLVILADRYVTQRLWREDLVLRIGTSKEEPIDKGYWDVCVKMDNLISELNRHEEKGQVSYLLPVYQL